MLSTSDGRVRPALRAARLARARSARVIERE